MGYTHHMVAENSRITVYERTDEGLFGLGILATRRKDYVVVNNHTGAAAWGRTVGDARANLEQFEGRNEVKLWPEITAA